MASLWHTFSSQRLFLDGGFYRDVAGFVLGFVSVHLDVCFSPAQRRDVIDAFFDVQLVPAARVIDVLVATLAKCDPSNAGGDQEDSSVTTKQCVRQLVLVIEGGEALKQIVTAMLEHEVSWKRCAADARCLD